MNASEFYRLLKRKFPFEPTAKQNIVLDQLSEFVFDATPNSLYLLKVLQEQEKQVSSGHSFPICGRLKKVQC